MDLTNFLISYQLPTQSLPSADPRKSPCQCGFRRRCGSEDNSSDPHSLSALGLRSTAYEESKEDSADPPKVIDHIVPLRTFKLGELTIDTLRFFIDERCLAYYQAMVSFQQFSSLFDWRMSFDAEYETLGKDGNREVIWTMQSKLWWPITISQEVCQIVAFCLVFLQILIDFQLQTLKELGEFFNSHYNLCRIDEDFNNKRNIFLTSMEPFSLTDKADKFPVRLWWYYRIINHRIFIISEWFIHQFQQTGNLVFWAVGHIIVENEREVEKAMRMWTGINEDPDLNALIQRNMAGYKEGEPLDIPYDLQFAPGINLGIGSP